MSNSDFNLLPLGADNLDKLPDALGMRSCAECMHWEDPDFWCSGDPPEILRTKKNNWFRRTSQQFDPCGFVATDNAGVTIAFAEFAPAEMFAGLDESLQISPDAPLVACLTVAEAWQGCGLGKAMVAAIEQSCASHGAKRVQTLCTTGPRRNPSGPQEFWESVGYYVAGRNDKTLLLVKEL